MGVIEQVSRFDDDLRAFRNERHHVSSAQIADSIRRLQQHGLADKRLDPVIAAAGLGAMTYRFPEMWFVQGLVDCDFDLGRRAADPPLRQRIGPAGAWRNGSSRQLDGGSRRRLNRSPLSQRSSETILARRERARRIGRSAQNFGLPLQELRGQQGPAGEQPFLSCALPRSIHSRSPHGGSTRRAPGQDPGQGLRRRPRVVRRRSRRCGRPAPGCRAPWRRLRAGRARARRRVGSRPASSAPSSR